VATPNPDFLTPPGGLKSEWLRMLAKPVGLERPLVVLAGWRAPVWPARALARRLARLAGTSAERTGAVSFASCFTFGAAVPRVASTIDRLWPSGSADETVEVDVVGISMGGLIARAAAMAGPGRKRVAIRRLFTLGTPHRGARAAPYVPLDALARDMRAGCEFLRRLDEALTTAPFELVCYTRLRDSWVGARNTAPAGREPIWTPGPALLSHQTVSLDPLIRTDLARRLRREEPLARRGSPPPRD
jgi:pimeloyl-ACP methyl ester carboxylesterase